MTILVEHVFFDITVIIFVCFVLSLLFRFFKQPVILAYITTGILLGPLGIFPLGNSDSLKTLAQVGITLVLFMLGLEIKIGELTSIGAVAFLSGFLQIVLTFLAGFLVSIFLGLSPISSLYIGLAITFSSTIVVVKLLSDKKDLTSLSSKLSIGILLVQDFFAVITLIILSAFSKGTLLTPYDFLWVFIKGMWLAVLLFAITKTILPSLIKASAKSTETLFLFSLAWVFSLSALVTMMGFSIEIGGFLAGITLASYSEHFQISARIGPLRDFFITIFFVLLGLESSFTNINSIILPAILLSFVVLCIKPYIVAQTLSALGYKKRTSFLTGLNIAQISEFSLIILFLGNKIGHIGSFSVSLITLVAIITFVFSTPAILKNKKTYKYFEKHIFLYQGKLSKGEEENEKEELKDHVVIVGGHQMGQSVLEALENGEDVIVVDFDPEIVKKLKAKGVRHLFGDIEDTDIQERVQLDSAKMVISTIPDLEGNLALIKRLNHENKKAKIVVMAYEANGAKALYKAGADYVVLPHLAGGRHIAKLLKENNLDHIERLKSKDLEFLK